MRCRILAAIAAALLWVSSAAAQSPTPTGTPTPLFTLFPTRTPTDTRTPTIKREPFVSFDRGSGGCNTRGDSMDASWLLLLIPALLHVTRRRSQS
jgi:hypothetical protein